MLPYTLSSSHIPLLDRFHKLVELSEATSMLRDLVNALHAAKSGGGKAVPDIKILLTNWRERLPNKFEDFSLWGSLFSWRMHVFRFAVSLYSKQDISPISIFNSVDPQVHLLHDSAWTLVKLASVARKQKLGIQAQSILNETYSFDRIDKRDAFLKLKEQIKLLLPSTNLGNVGVAEASVACCLINNSNMDCFTDGQKAELFTLKADALFQINSSGYFDILIFVTI